MAAFQNLQNRRYGLLVVRDRDNSQPGIVRWNCICDCGNVLSIRGGNLRSGNTKSCGCVRNEMTGRRSLKHGQSVGYKSTPEHRAWKQALNRCRNSKLKSWEHYGGRGISVCPEWEASFQAFFDHVGNRPSPVHSLDRINVDGNYEPGNVRWATRVEQARNTRRNTQFEYRGEAGCFADMVDIAGINYSTAKDRKLHGWSIADIIETPARETPVFLYRGIEYSLSELARGAGIHRSSLQNRLRIGLSIEEAVTTPIRSKSQRHLSLRNTLPPR